MDDILSHIELLYPVSHTVLTGESAIFLFLQNNLEGKDPVKNRMRYKKFILIEFHRTK